MKSRKSISVKRVLHVLAAFLLVVYMSFAVAFMNPQVEEDKPCAGVEIEIMETGGNSYLNRAQIESPLKSANKYPAGKKMSEIKVGDIEKTLENNRLIKKAEAYKTIDGRIKICVYQRIPVLRVMHGGEGYYVDNEAQIMPVPAQYAAYVPLATGFIPRDYACEQLYEFAEFLREHKYWNEHIEQINVLPNRDVELIPRKGSHTILLGKIEDYRENLDKLKLFYEKGLSKIGWNKYSQINLKYKNLVICTKRK